MAAVHPGRAPEGVARITEIPLLCKRSSVYPAIQKIIVTSVGSSASQAKMPTDALLMFASFISRSSL